MDSPAATRERELVGQHLQAHQALDPAEQRNVVDRFGQEIIGAGFEPAHPIVRLVQGGHHHDGDMLGLAVGLDAAADFDAVHAGHHHVEQHDVGLRRAARSPAHRRRSSP